MCPHSTLAVLRAVVQVGAQVLVDGAHAVGNVPGLQVRCSVAPCVRAFLRLRKARWQGTLAGCLDGYMEVVVQGSCPPTVVYCDAAPSMGTEGLYCTLQHLIWQRARTGCAVVTGSEGASGCGAGQQGTMLSVACCMVHQE